MIKVEHISRRYKTIAKSYEPVILIDDISFSLDVGDYAYIKGASGTGKTTLLNILSGFTKPDKGNVFIDFDDTAYMPCGNCLFESLTIKENIELTDFNIDLIKKLKIEHILDLYPRQISSGEYKRALLAEILGLKKTCLLLDEPTSNLDSESANIIIDIINDIRKDKIIVVATHDERLMKGKEICLQKHQKEY